MHLGGVIQFNQSVLIITLNSSGSRLLLIPAYPWPGVELTVSHLSNTATKWPCYIRKSNNGRVERNSVEMDVEMDSTEEYW